MKILSDKKVLKSIEALGSEFCSHSTDVLKTQFRSRGLRVLGSGVEAVAIKYDNKCYKFIPGGSDAYMEYLQLIPYIKCVHTPEIYDITEISQTIIVEMELLFPLQKNYSFYYYNDPYNDMLEGKPAPRDFIALKKLLEEYCAQQGEHSFDLHQYNVMKRKNGDYVITDPFC